MIPYDDIRPFNISVPDQQLHELHTKLDLTRLPDELDLPAEQEWEWGIPLARLRPLVEYWRTQYEWRVVEERINRTLPQFTACIDSLNHGPQEVHFVHKRSDNPEATPLIFIHGWPGSFLEVSKMIDELTNPTDPKHPAFHVVAPSLPGFVFSQRAGTPGMGAKGTSYLFDRLMDKLGYKYYIAQGGDWGALVCRALAVYHQHTCLGTHYNLHFFSIPTFWKNPLVILKTILGFAGLPGGYSKLEIDNLRDTQEFEKMAAGYFRIQETRPQTLAFALTDSPVGLLAWMGEKLYTWTDNYPWTHEELITWVMLYWIKGPAGGLRYYKENTRSVPRNLSQPTDWNELHSKWSPTPGAFSSFPKEIIRLPSEWTGLHQKQVYIKTHEKGGHFAAWEVPELLMEDIRNFTRIVLSNDPRLCAS